MVPFGNIGNIKKDAEKVASKAEEFGKNIITVLEQIRDELREIKLDKRERHKERMITEHTPLDSENYQKVRGRYL